MIWDEWRQLTRFMESGRIALSRESSLWSSLELADPGSAKVRASNGIGAYEVALDSHVEAVSDDWLFCASVLVLSYAIAEAAVADKFGLDDLNGFSGIEDWGQRLLDDAGADWGDVLDGRPGAVEVATIRNTIAHGDRNYSQRSINRLQAAGAGAGLVPGDPVVLDDSSLRLCRSRLKSLLRLGEVQSPGPTP